MREDWPDFDAFTLRELYESREGLDAERFPDRLAYVEALIARREAGEAPKSERGAETREQHHEVEPPRRAQPGAPTVDDAVAGPTPAASPTAAAPVQASAEVDDAVATLVVRRLCVGTVVRISTIASVVLALITFVAYTALAVLLMLFGGDFPAPDAVTLAGSLFVGALFFLIFFLAVVIGAAISGAITGLTMALGLWVYARYEPLVLRFVPASPAE